MAYGGLNKQKRDAAAEIGMNPASNISTRFSLSGVENEEADTGREGRTRPARQDSQARTGTGKYSFFLFS